MRSCSSSLGGSAGGTLGDNWAGGSARRGTDGRKGAAGGRATDGWFQSRSVERSTLLVRLAVVQSLQVACVDVCALRKGGQADVVGKGLLVSGHVWLGAVAADTAVGESNLEWKSASGPGSEMSRQVDSPYWITQIRGGIDTGLLGADFGTGVALS